MGWRRGKGLLPKRLDPRRGFNAPTADDQLDAENAVLLEGATLARIVGEKDVYALELFGRVNQTTDLVALLFLAKESHLELLVAAIQDARATYDENEPLQGDPTVEVPWGAPTEESK